MNASLFVLATLGLLAVLPVDAGKAGDPPKTIQIAVTKTFVTDQPSIFVEIAVGEFNEVFKKTTGLVGSLNAKDGLTEIADKLNDKKLDFAILYAHEFAWAQKKHPDLQPMMIAATKKQDKRAHIIVHKNNPAKTLADLRGKKLDLPLRSKEYCRLYIEKACSDKMQGGAAAFFGSIAKSGSQAAALDQVAREEAHATVVDTPWLDFYKEVKGPVFDKNLRILQQSEVVPPAVVVFKRDAIEKATMDQVRAGLRKAHTDNRGRILMDLWHIDSFEPVPKDYGKRLAEVLKEYPPPE